MQTSVKVVCVGRIIRYGTEVSRTVEYDPDFLSGDCSAIADLPITSEKLECNSFVLTAA